jgi:hypothetical protein
MKYAYGIYEHEMKMLVAHDIITRYRVSKSYHNKSKKIDIKTNKNNVK